MLARWTGTCNAQKDALNVCLRQEVRYKLSPRGRSPTQRIDRTTRNREEAKERTAKKKAIWAEIDRERGVPAAASSEARS